MTDALSEITTLGSVASLLGKTLLSCDIDPAPLFNQAGIDLSAASKPDTRFPTQRMQTLWGLALEATGNPGLGLLVAQQFQPAVLHGLGFAWLASDTLLDALGRLARYSRFINTGVEFRVEVTPDTTDLVIAIPDIFPNFVYAATDFGMAASLRMCQITAGKQILPVHVALQRPTPPCKETFSGQFGASIEYGATVNRLCFDNELASQPLNTANPELARINDQTVVDYLARFDRASIAMQVRAKIIEQLPDRMPRQEDIADTLHVSLRSLQRRLREEETSFKNLMEDTRKTLAMQYLRESHRSIGEVTYLLGFSEPSNFTRAFRRWTGKSPAAFRDTSRN
ncbi:MAG TPA: AraC family transcriptional regulator [Gammaproteobacteria bacterium]|nr:AraC family transcriptional regulator [Gammaproteobacteria bacterium]